MTNSMPAFRMLCRNQPAQVVQTSIPDPGPHEVLIRIGGAGLCASDLKVLSGTDSYNISTPLTLGHENAGWIAKIGSHVSEWSLGDAVVVSCLGGCGSCPQCGVGLTQYCAEPMTPGITYDGGLAHYVVANANQIVALGDLSVPEAAPLADAGMTSYHAVELCDGALGNRETIVLIGMGGLGSMAVQIAKAKGWPRIIVADVTEQKRDRALALGATDFLVSGPQLVGRIHSLVGVVGVTAVIDLVGIDTTLQAAAEMVRPGGRVVQVGTGDGSLEFGRQHIKPGVSFIQARGGSITDLQAVVAMLTRGELLTEIQPIGLQEVANAYREMAAGNLTRRAVVVFDQIETQEV